MICDGRPGVAVNYPYPEAFRPVIFMCPNCNWVQPQPFTDDCDPCDEAWYAIIEERKRVKALNTLEGWGLVV